jgi:hypothetical protein
VLAAAGVVALLPLAFGLARGLGGPVPWAVLVLGAAYTVSLFLPKGRVDVAAPLVAACLLLTSELACWSVELRTPVEAERGLILRRAGLLAAVCAVTLPVGVVVLAATELPLGGGVAWDAVGVVAALGAVGIVAALARRAGR